MQDVRPLITLFVGILIIIFRKPIARSMAKSQIRITKHKHKSPEIIEKAEKVAYPIFEIATIAFGVLCILWGLPELLKVFKTMF